jgi:hypothetical protein
MGEKAATKEVISELVSALGDESWNVSSSAGEALRKMDKKVGTNDAINKLVILVNSDKSRSYYAANAIESILSSSSVIAQLDPKIISDLCLCKRASDCLTNVSAEQLIEWFFTTKNPDWLSAVTGLTLLKGAAVITIEDKVVVYGSKEPFELPVLDSILRQQLIEAFTEQAKRLHLSLEMSSKAPRNEPKVSGSSSCCCDIL